MNAQNHFTAHCAIIDWMAGELRHLARITPQAERPFETSYVPEEESKDQIEGTWVNYEINRELQWYLAEFHMHCKPR